MVSAEDALESDIWHALRFFKVTCAEPVKFVDAVIAAARAYAAGDSEALTAARRERCHVLRQASR